MDQQPRVFSKHGLDYKNQVNAIAWRHIKDVLMKEGYNLNNGKFFKAKPTVVTRSQSQASTSKSNEDKTSK